MEKAVAYYRVSTKRQQRSGLGLDAQRAAVTRFTKAEGMTLVGEYVEVETGKGAHDLNKQGIRAARGKRWHASSVMNLLARTHKFAEAR